MVVCDVMLSLAEYGLKDLKDFILSNVIKLNLLCELIHVLFLLLLLNDSKK